MSPIELLAAEYADLTQYELASRDARVNLTDAMNARKMSEDYPQVVERLPALWLKAERMGHAAAEERFLERFFAFMNRANGSERRNAMLVYSASVAVSIVATYLLQKGLSVAMTTPCIDNLPDILKHKGVPVRGLPESLPLDAGLADAFFIVDPTNPTGRSILKDGPGTLDALIEFALAHDKLLIFDFSFAAFHERRGGFDVYERLEASGVRFIAIEDTGKVWPSQALKASVIKTSADVHADVFNIKTGYLLGVPNFTLLMIMELMDALEKSPVSYFDAVARHHGMVQDAFAGTPIRYAVPQVKVPAAWCRIDELGVSAEQFCARLGLEDVCILPGGKFFWDGSVPPGEFIRISMSRDTALVREGLARIRAAALRLEPAPAS
ncbi:MAG: hypothetical protein HYZ75_15570 [Elusimicrobia bacterium]|nr:hypothetical protein [Elusimicrobiota bacterium]